MPEVEHFEAFEALEFVGQAGEQVLVDGELLEVAEEADLRGQRRQLVAVQEQLLQLAQLQHTRTHTTLISSCLNDYYLLINIKIFHKLKLQLELQFVKISFMSSETIPSVKAWLSCPWKW